VAKAKGELMVLGVALMLVIIIIVVGEESKEDDLRLEMATTAAAVAGSLSSLTVRIVRKDDNMVLLDDEANMCDSIGE